jgi:hypothetical protein
MKSFCMCAALGLVIAAITGCGKQEVEPTAQKWDPASIAAEFDKGNPKPLYALGDACSKEVKDTGKRGDACGVQDQVRRLVKPVNIRF